MTYKSESAEHYHFRNSESHPVQLYKILPKDLLLLVAWCICRSSRTTRRGYPLGDASAHDVDLSVLRVVDRCRATTMSVCLHDAAGAVAMYSLETVQQLFALRVHLRGVAVGKQQIYS
jgi:hypothetical protein